MGDAGAGRGARRGPRLPLRLRPRRRCWPAPGSGARRAAGAALGAAAAGGLRPRPLPGRAAAPLLAPRPGPQPLARRARRAARRRLRGDRQRPLPRPRRARLQDAFVAVRLGTTLEASEPGRRGNSSSALDLAGEDGRALRRASRGGRRDPAPRRAPALRPDQGARLPLPGLRGPGRRPRAGRGLPGAARGALRGAHHRYRAEAGGRLEQELATIRNLGLSGFFLLHRDILELAREVALRGARPGVGALRPAPGTRPRLQRQLDRLLPDRPLPHRPGPERPLLRPLPQRGDRGRARPDDARHRPRLPARHPRGPDPPRPRGLRHRPRRPRRRLPDLPPARGGARPRQGAGAAGRRRSSGSRGWSASTSGPGRSSATSSPRSAPRRAASPGWRALLAALRRGDGPAPPRLPAPGRDGDLDPAADRRLPGRPGGDGGAADRPVGQGLLLGRRLPQDRPARPGDALRGRALRRRSGADAPDEPPLDLSRIDFEDRETFESIQRAETTGVFQIESRAQMQMLPRTLPENLDDLTVQVALVRPGPIQGGAVHPYIERRKRLREDPGFEIPYDHPLLEEVAGGDARHDRLPGAGARSGEGAGRLLLGRGGGAAAGDEPQALRGGDRPPPPSASSRAPRGNGVGEATAERVWEQIQGFSGFGFPKAHSAAFGLLAYQSAWLRVHRAPEFLCALLNEQPMGFYPPDSLVHEAQRRGVRVAGPDANRSRVLCRVERERGRAGGAGRARLRQGGARGGDGEPRRRPRARRPLPRDRRPRLALGRRPRRARAAGLGGGAGRDPARLRRRGRRSPRGALAGRGRAERPRGGEGAQLALPLEPPRAAGAGAAGRTGRR